MSLVCDRWGMDNCGDGSDQASWPPANCGGQWGGVAWGPAKQLGWKLEAGMWRERKRGSSGDSVQTRLRTSSLRTGGR